MENNHGMNLRFICIFQENTVPILSVDTTPALTAGYSFHPCKRGKCFFLVLETLWRLRREPGCRKVCPDDARSGNQWKGDEAAYKPGAGQCGWAALAPQWRSQWFILTREESNCMAVLPVPHCIGFGASRAPLSQAIPLALAMTYLNHNWNIKHRVHSDVHFDAQISILNFSSLTDSDPSHLPPHLSFHHTFKNRSLVSFEINSCVRCPLTFYIPCLSRPLLLVPEDMMITPLSPLGLSWLFLRHEAVSHCACASSHAKFSALGSFQIISPHPLEQIPQSNYNNNRQPIF